jgi:hypothetical protein
VRGRESGILPNNRGEVLSTMSAREKFSKKGKRPKTLDDVLDCEHKCTGFPYDCLDCSEEPVFKNEKGTKGNS